MEVRLLVDKSIRGEPAFAGDVVEVGELVGQWLIDEGFAEFITIEEIDD
jgi:hypothetical protein